MKNRVLGCIATVLVAVVSLAPLSAAADRAAVASTAEAIEEQVISWRRDIHQHPELGNREFRTAALVAKHLRELGLETVITEVAHTGVVGVLRGGRPGPVVALRADMDALPVKEVSDLPFASQVTADYNGQQVPVMHACGHDNHVAILMGAAQVLAGMRSELAGTVKFIFQPAEEGPPAGEEGGAKLMVGEGVLADPEPEVIFGLHVGPMPGGSLNYRPRGALAAADGLQILVEGSQTHGAFPWMGVDPVVIAAQIISALQIIPSRQLDITTAPAVISIGSIHGGVRGNIIPDQVEMTGTIRTFDPEMREDFHRRIRRTAESIGVAAGAEVTVEIESYAPVTFNDPELTARMIPTLEWAAGDERLVNEIPRIMGAEDFAFYQEQIPGFYFFLGVNAAGVAPADAAPNHSPHFFANEDALVVGVRAMAGMVVDYLNGS